MITDKWDLMDVFRTGYHFVPKCKNTRCFQARGLVSEFAICSPLILKCSNVPASPRLVSKQVVSGVPIWLSDMMEPVRAPALGLDQEPQFWSKAILTGFKGRHPWGHHLCSECSDLRKWWQKYNLKRPHIFNFKIVLLNNLWWKNENDKLFRTVG